MSKMGNVFAFTSGVAVGAVGTWYLLKNMYEQRTLEEVESVKEVYSRKIDNEEDNIDDAKSKANEASSKPSIKEYAAKLQKQGYTDYSDISNKKEEDDVEKPYVISPEDFGEFDDYEHISLTYYSDQVLTDENDEVIEDVEDIIGFDSLSRFGEFEEDAIHVRNDRLKCDYEILKDEKRYEDVVRTNPR